MADDKEELERLRRQLDEITAERDVLLADNRRLRPEFGSPQKSHSADQSNLVRVTSNPSASGSVAVNNESPLSEKVQLFRFLKALLSHSIRHLPRTMSHSRLSS